MKERLLNVLKKEYPQIDFLTTADLVDDSILDSLTIVGVISAISMEFGIIIPYEDIVPENFNSVDAMVELISRLVKEK